MRQLLLVITGSLYIQICNATVDSTLKMQRRKTLAWGLDIGVATGVHAALYKAWYSGYAHSKFHWINDNHEWLQMDKVGHAWSSAIIAANTAVGFEWAGYNRRKSAIYGAASALVFQYAIEYFDGKSAAWGASKGDLVANTAGLTFAGVQRYFWGKCIVPFRFTVHASPYSKIRPNLLGSNFPEHILKDYNGQTYWLDFNPERMRIRPKWWPRFLGICVGYGAEGMVGGDDNIWTDKFGVVQDRSDIKRYRQFFLSPAITFGHVKSKFAWVNALAWLSEHIRVPMPAIEFSPSNRPQFHLLYW